MGVVQTVKASRANDSTFEVGTETNGLWASRPTTIIVYVLLLAAASFRLYQRPIYSMDLLAYMGNALLMEETDPVRLHQRVYSEITQRVPVAERRNFLGQQAGAPVDQNRSRQERAADPYNYAEFLPFFAIRPLYNELLYVLSKTGVGLVRAAVVISAVSHFLLGILLFLWMRRYVNPWYAVAMSLLLMISPPLLLIGRDTGSDALSTLVAFFAIYLIFERRLLAAGFALLLVSIYCRTDNVVLAGLTIFACWVERKLDFWKAAVLAVVSVASVLAINYFAGDYGVRMLYYRNFIGVPLTPAEMVIHFSVSDYLAAFRSGITNAMAGVLIPFLILGMGGIVQRGPLRTVAVLMTAYALLHFVLLPNWQERWFCLLYLSMGLAAASAVQLSVANTRWHVRD